MPDPLGGSPVQDYPFLVVWIIVGALLVVRWGYALVATRDKPPEWEAPGRHTWPFGPLRRDTYRRQLAVFLAFLVIGELLLVAYALLLVLRP